MSILSDLFNKPTVFEILLHLAVAVFIFTLAYKTGKDAKHFQSLMGRDNWTVMTPFIDLWQRFKRAVIAFLEDKEDKGDKGDKGDDDKKD